MQKKVSPQDLTVEELRRLLVEKRRSVRHDRLEHYKRTGRVVHLVSDTTTPAYDPIRTSTLIADEEEVTRRSLRARFGRWFDGFLLLVEVAAVLGLGLVLFNGLEILRSLNQESAQVLTLPTLTPTPLITALVLPSGHTPPNSPGGAQPNDAEVPEHLRPLILSLANVPIPTPGPEQAQNISIPAINVYAPIVQGDGWEQLKKGVGQHIPSTNPGMLGNLVLTAHNDVFGEIFRDLDRLQPGDEVVVYTNQHAYTYRITGTQVVEPTQVDVMGPTEDATITLISCYPYLIDNQRIIVKGVLQSTTR